MDVAAWLLEQAGAPVPPDLEPRSPGPAFASADWRGRPAVDCEQVRDGILTDAEIMTMVRTPDWRFVHVLHADHGQRFALRADPGECRKRGDDPAWAPVRRRMHDTLLEWRIDSRHRTR